MAGKTVGLSDCCDVVRSKNAGPFLVTVDLIFSHPATYRAVLEQGLLTREIAAAAYGLQVRDIVSFETSDLLAAVKFTFRRRRPSGSPGDSDCYGMSQEAPVLSLRFPASVLHSDES